MSMHTIIMTTFINYNSICIYIYIYYTYMSVHVCVIHINDIKDFPPDKDVPNIRFNSRSPFLLSVIDFKLRSQNK